MTADEARLRVEAKLKADRVREAGDLLKVVNAEALLGRRWVRFNPDDVSVVQAEALKGLGYGVERTFAPTTYRTEIWPNGETKVVLPSTEMTATGWEVRW